MPTVKIKTIKDIVPSEDNECMALVNYLKLRGLKFSHLAQSTAAVSYVGGVRKPNWKTIKRNQALGVTKGIPDYMILIEREGSILSGPKNNLLLFIEMKKSKGGKVSPEQADWINGLNKVYGIVAMVCQGFDQAKEAIDAFLYTPGTKKN